MLVNSITFTQIFALIYGNAIFPPLKEHPQFICHHCVYGSTMGRRRNYGSAMNSCLPR
ncbi:hypothetical protein HanRHA438_Chr09g0411781 [Helianthus annuus]|uniref:Uncharacterized protein n=1 Tax=Helianthus annuus TaxID=4232 RepID=A0A251S4S4_HELAN|nr:hypothetical protein HanXRQr2_Chr09g0399951 [Helianthus annuus]KAF5791894.1 hypothetical protein HanXRQr2_Chr09g0399971 [Helianthus annuus]KAJ0526903.1 hypothetical protein HanHA300_Chr09g0328311 [Helianthus annuus]KAJ0535457.1 hypothetical protein HanIR_Chr09g0430871 [Helianthus annuus]KAJ0543298.1 hypothetical protein HanHA89_Chr09g0349211 [Helianthus annuus]